MEPFENSGGWGAKELPAGFAVGTVTAYPRRQFYLLPAASSNFAALVSELTEQALCRSLRIDFGQRG